MKISELIAELEKAMAEHGDMQVYYFDNEFGCEAATQVAYREKPSHMYESRDAPGVVIE